MKIVTIAPSPYLLISTGQLNASVLQHLFFNNFAVASFVWGHDINYFLPEQDKNGKTVYYFTFENDSHEYKIPLLPFDRNANESVAIYEMCNLLKPDVILTIGELRDFAFMRALKMFYTHGDIKWMHIAAQGGFPINENDIELVDDADSILCTNYSAFNAFSNICQHDRISVGYVGSIFENTNIQQNAVPEAHDVVQGMVCAKNFMIDNIPVAMESACIHAKLFHDFRLYVHAPIYSAGDYDLNLVKSRYDSNNIIHFPEKYVSAYDGVSLNELSQLYSLSDIFISPTMLSATAMSVCDAISHGCVPLVVDTGCQAEIAADLAAYLDLPRDTFIIPCTTFLGSGETRLSVCRADDVVEKIIFAQNKGIKHKNIIADFGKTISRKGFLSKLCEMIQVLKDLRPSLALDAVT